MKVLSNVKRFGSPPATLTMKISLGTDHAGFHYKEKVKELLGQLGHEVKDFGTFSDEPVDYPVFIRPAAEAVVKGECDRGIVFGGSGNGEAIAANKVPGVRAALAWEPWIARGARRWNDANVLALSLKRLAPDVAVEVVQAFLDTTESDPDEWANIERLRELEG